MTNRAQYAEETAFLFKPRGEQKAREWFGEAVDALPRFTRGKYKGAIKGVVCWRKCVRGGWVSSDGGFGGFVENRVGQVVHRALRELPKFGEDPTSGKAVATWEAE